MKSHDFPFDGLLHVTFLIHVPETVPHVSSEITIILY